METKKYEIYNYWKDKAITKNFEVKLWEVCTADDEAVKITGFPDEIFCWACEALPYVTADTDNIKTLWNHDHFLNRAHIFAKSKGGEDTPSNLFLLCPNCHAEAPDTTNLQNFYAWVYYKRRFDNWVLIYKKEFEKAADIKRVDAEELYKRWERLNLNLDTVEALRSQMAERCALHGSAISMSSKMMSFIDILLELTEE
ncbi:HNH endonuclease [Lacrimispora sp. NSJ-141]|uniref:HNH endonuclease n=1 Tax=Lientehia hominis TaxID=2897778 RepID=A0AAP2RKX4_9FIRM|nr:HNH endonuclease [Lientehia hominis]MCD2493641.1 HNH endonuclease [Lientehia hominis]